MSIIITIILAILYFFPTYVAYRNKKSNTGAIAALNIFFGWTLLGWVGALVWALVKEKK